MTLLQACQRKLGRTKGGLALANIALHAMATNDLGHVPTAVEYSEYWSVTERTAWNHRARARAVLGDDWKASVVVLAEQLAAAQDRSHRSVGALPYPQSRALASA